MKKLVLLLTVIPTSFLVAQNYNWKLYDTTQYPFLRYATKLTLNDSGNAVDFTSYGIAIAENDSLEFIPAPNSANTCQGAYDAKNNIYYLSKDCSYGNQDDSTLQFKNGQWSVFYSEPDPNAEDYVIEYCGGMYVDYFGNLILNYFELAALVRGDYNGVWVRKNGVWDEFFNDAILNIAFDSLNNYWFNDYHGTIYKLSSDSLYSYSPSAKWGIENPYQMKLTVDHKGVLWLSDVKKLVSVSGDQVIDYPYQNVPYDSLYMRDLFSDKNNHLFASTYHGILIFNGTDFQEINHLNSNIPSDNIFQTVVDDQGNIWASVSNGLAECESCASVVNGVKPVGSNNLRFYPNPTRNKVIIDLSNVNSAIMNIQVTNTIGQTIISEKIDGKTSITLDFSNEPRGIYIVKLTGGKQEYNAKLEVL